MAATRTRKYPLSGNSWFSIWVGTDNTTNPNTERFAIAEVRVNKAAYDALAAAGKSDIDAVTIGSLITEPFD